MYFFWAIYFIYLHLNTINTPLYITIITSMRYLNFSNKLIIWSFIYRTPNRFMMITITITVSNLRPVCSKRICFHISASEFKTNYCWIITHIITIHITIWSCLHSSYITSILTFKWMIFNVCNRSKIWENYWFLLTPYILMAESRCTSIYSWRIIEVN